MQKQVFSRKSNFVVKNKERLLMYCCYYDIKKIVHKTKFPSQNIWELISYLWFILYQSKHQKNAYDTSFEDPSKDVAKLPYIFSWNSCWYISKNMIDYHIHAV